MTSSELSDFLSPTPIGTAHASDATVQSAIYDRYNKAINWNQGTNIALSQTRIPTFVCPSNPDGGALDTAPPGSTAAFIPGIAASTDYSPIFGIAPGVFTQTLGLSAPPELYRDPAEVFAGVNPPYTYVRGFFPKNATINPSTGLQTSKGYKFSNVSDGLSNTLAIAESAGRPFVYVKRKKLAGGNALNDTDASSANTDRIADRHPRNRRPLFVSHRWSSFRPRGWIGSVYQRRGQPRCLPLFGNTRRW